MKAEVKTITPEIAQKMLESNTNNRGLGIRAVKSLSDAMLRGEWKFNGDPIRVSKEGVLLDGQHRLNAVIKSGMTFDFLVISELDSDVFTTIDIGKKRSGVDALSMEGFKNTSTLASACRMLVSSELYGSPFVSSRNTSDVSLQQVVDFANDDDMIHESAAFADKEKGIGKLFQKSNVAYCHYIFNKKSPSEAKLFFDELTSGHYSYRNSPIMALKEMFMNFVIRGIKPTRDEKLAYMFKAFRALRRSAQVKVVRLDKSRDNWYKL